MKEKCCKHQYEKKKSVNPVCCTSKVLKTFKQSLAFFFFFEVNDANLRSFVETSLVVTTNSADPEVASHATKIEFKKSEKEA